jgi:hypothetical protein
MPIDLLVSSVGWYWIAVPAAVALLGFLVFVAGIGHAVKRRPVRAGVHLTTGAAATVLGLAFSLIGLNAQTYSRLSYESGVALVHVKAVDPAQSLYDVTVTHLDSNAPPVVCRIQGDEWVMSARVQKWKPWANALGLDSTYRLDQLSNKYFTAERGNGHLITACDLRAPKPVVNQYVPEPWLFWLFDQSVLEDRRFGSAAYMPLADGADYRVIMTQSGLNAEAVNAKAKAANNARPGDPPSPQEDKDGFR